jgi:hypothetical protein
MLFLDNMQINLGNSGAAISANASRGTSQKLTLTANCNLSVTGLVNNKPAWIQLEVIQDNIGSRGLTITGAKTVGGFGLLLSSTPGAIDIVDVFWNGSTLFAIVGGLNFQ